MEFVNITPQVTELVHESGIQEGLAPHDPSRYRHNQTGKARFRSLGADLLR